MLRKRKAVEDTAPPPQRTLRKRHVKQCVYEPLLYSEIRILVLEPGQGDDPLQAKLEITDRAKRPKYKAISYTWGAPVFDYTLHLPGGQLEITKSLADALKCFRNQKTAVRLWADAVCIDQNGIEEKNHQVEWMHEIYEHAEHVLVWLGDAVPSDCLALFLLTTLAKLPVHRSEDWSPQVKAIHKQTLRTSDEEPEWRTCEQCRSRFNVSGPLSTQQALTDFKNRSWFSRLWIMQEVACAKDFTMYFGCHKVSSNTAKAAARPSLVQRRFLGIPSIDENPLNDWPVMALCSTYGRAGPGEPQSILECIIRSNHAACALPHDRIFALRRLANVCHIHCLRPNYSLSTQDLWLRVAVIALTHLSNWTSYDGNFEPSPFLTLSLAGAQKRWIEGHEPSWVPDFGNVTEDCIWKSDQHWSSGPRNRAGGQVDGTVLTDMSSRSCCLQGKILTHIETTSPGTQYFEGLLVGLDVARTDWSDTFARDVFCWFERCLSYLVASGRPGALSAESFTDIMLYCQWPGKVCATQEMQELIEMHLRDWSDRHRPGLSDTFDFRVLSIMIAGFDECSYCFRTFCDRTRILAVTTDGHFGWVPEAAQLRDAVVLFQGCPFPFILRKRPDGCYMVIGDAYIHGIMKGEAWPGDNETGVEEITLK